MEKPDTTGVGRAEAFGQAGVASNGQDGVLAEFQTELIDLWPRLPNKGFFFVLFAAWLTLFHFLGNSTFGYIQTPSLFRWMYNVYTAKQPDGTMSDDSLGLLVPVLVLALFWWKRKELMERPPDTWWPGLLLTAAGMAMHVAGYLIQQPRVSIAALFVGIYGLMGLAWGSAWLRKSFFPFFLFMFCVPFASLAEPITIRLRLLASWIVEVICHIFRIDVIREGNILRDPTGAYQYEVAAACSGIRSLIAIGLFAVVCSFIFFQQWWRRAVLIALAAPFAVAGNVLRLLTIILAAEMGGQDWGHAVHEGGPVGIFSLMPYVPAFIGILFVEKVLREGKPPEADPV